MTNLSSEGSDLREGTHGPPDHSDFSQGRDRDHENLTTAEALFQLKAEREEAESVLGEVSRHRLPSIVTGPRQSPLVSVKQEYLTGPEARSACDSTSLTSPRQGIDLTKVFMSVETSGGTSLGENLVSSATSQSRPEPGESSLTISSSRPGPQLPPGVTAPLGSKLFSTLSQPRTSELAPLPLAGIRPTTSQSSSVQITVHRGGAQRGLHHSQARPRAASQHLSLYKSGGSGSPHS